MAVCENQIVWASNSQSVAAAINAGSAGKIGFIPARFDWASDRIEEDVLSALRKAGRAEEFDVVNFGSGVEVSIKGS